MALLLGIPIAYCSSIFFMFVSIDGIIFKQVRLEETTTIVHGNFHIAFRTV
jgi:hypothetical protein